MITTFKGIKDSMFRWTVSIKGEEFNYSMGLGHSKLPYPLESNTQIRMLSGSTFKKKVPTGYISVPTDRVSVAAFMGVFNLNRAVWNAERLKEVYAKKPRFREVIYSLAQDAFYGDQSFEGYCADMGLDTDSRKALQSYLDCQDTGHKLRKMGYNIERIMAWEL